MLVQFIRHNAVFLLLLVVAIAVYSIFVLPWLRDSGHTALSIAGYAIFAMLVVYGRANRSKKRDRSKRDSNAA